MPVKQSKLKKSEPATPKTPKFTPEGQVEAWVKGTIEVTHCVS